MRVEERAAESAKRSGLITFGILLVLAIPWVDSEWKGGWLQAIGGATLLAAPAGVTIWGVKSARDSDRARVLLRFLLVLVVLLSVAGIYSYGMFTAPLCLAPLWLAARRAGPRERFLWILLAAPCALIFGWLVSYSFDHRIQSLPAVFTLTVVVLFLVSTRRSLWGDDR